MNSQNGVVGHRRRLRDRFLAGDEKARTDETLLELLLTYAIPQRDVAPVARQMLARYGDLDSVLRAEAGSLCLTDGIKQNSATLIKLVDWLRSHSFAKMELDVTCERELQPPLFECEDQHVQSEAQRQESEKPERSAARPRRISRRTTKLFGRAALKEAIEFLPRLPDTESLDEVTAFLLAHLHFNSVLTRQRSAECVVQTMFPEGRADAALRKFAVAYAGTQELRDVCYYRLCKTEPAMLVLTDDVLLPAIGSGRAPRRRLRDFVLAQLPRPNGVNNYTSAIVSVLAAANVAKTGRDEILLAYREIPIPSFAFVLHSEFPAPGMYDIGELENNPAIRAMLWNPDRILPALYELRNLGLVAKISEIDRVRQFTTKWSLDQAMRLLIEGKTE